MSKAEELFHIIAKEIPGAKEGKMFGALCIKTPNGKAAIIFKNDNMVFKLNKQDEAEAMKLAGAKVFDPMKAKPMNGWTELPHQHSGTWKDWAVKAVNFVKQLEK